jgi:preprotein translocase subunit SecD
MKVLRGLLLVSMLGVVSACSGDNQLLQGHALRVFAVEKQDINWITQDDVASSSKGVDASGHATLRLRLNAEGAARLRTLTAANVGKIVRFTWDGATVSDMSVQGAFGDRLELPAPPT